MKQINPSTLMQPRGYNNGMLAVAAKVLFNAGQVGWDEKGKMADGFTAQFDRALWNVLEVVRAAGGKAESIGRFTIFVKDKKQYIAARKEVGIAYRKHM